jgi:hypothetical protein
MKDIKRHPKFYAVILMWSILLFLFVSFDIAWELFEDGSFILSGCLPWNICS